MRTWTNEHGNRFEKSNGECVLQEFEEVDSAQLHYFVLSVLWRASASRLVEFRSFDLGPYQDEVAKVVTGESIQNAHDFPFILRYDSDPVVSKGFFTPTRIPVEGVNFVRFFGAGFAFDVKVSNKPIPKSLKVVENEAGIPVKVLSFKLMDTGYGIQMARGAKNSKALYGKASLA